MTLAGGGTSIVDIAGGVRQENGMLRADVCRGRNPKFRVGVAGFGGAVTLILIAGASAEPAIPGATLEFGDASRGQVLIDALNCTACHDISGFEPVAPLAAPNFSNSLANRFHYDDLRDWINDPHEVKPGTRMADVVESEEDAEALTQFLYYAMPPNEPREPLPIGDIESGRELYATIGCVACHAPEGAEPEAPSVPITLAELWHEDWLAEYLLDPTTAAMPKFDLTLQNASDLAAYLKRNAKVVKRSPPPEPDSGQMAQGSAIFASRGCAKCHGNPPGALVRGGRETRRKLIPARMEEGCLADEVEGRAPNFHLSDAQRASIREAIAEPVETPPIEHTMAVLNCAACHERAGIGGPADERKPFFEVTNELAESIGDLGNIPPKLDHVGRKLNPAWLQQLLAGEGIGVRPYMATRMPVFRHEAVEKLSDWLAKADRRDPPMEIDTSGLRRHQRGHYGSDLVGITGLGCVTCHGLKGEKPLGSPSIDLTHTVERLQPGYFKELLLNPAEMQPGTLMPPLFLERKKRDEEIEQIWTYLKEIDQRRLPEGLLKTGDFELKPVDEGKPIILRTFLEGAGMQAIAVGFPEGLSVAFDAHEVRWALAWRGRFLDAMSTWDERAATPAKPLGEDVKEFPFHEAKLEFRGFRLGEDGVPTFLYANQQLLVEDTILPQDETTLVRTVLVKGRGLVPRLDGSLTEVADETFTEEIKW